MHYSTLKVAEVALTAVLPLNETHIAAAVAANKAQLEAENLRKLNAEAKNVLESFIIDTRDKLSSDEVYEAVSTEVRGGKGCAPPTAGFVFELRLSCCNLRDL